MWKSNISQICDLHYCLAFYRSGNLSNAESAHELMLVMSDTQHAITKGMSVDCKRTKLNKFIPVIPFKKLLQRFSPKVLFFCRHVLTNLLRHRRAGRIAGCGRSECCATSLAKPPHWRKEYKRKDGASVFTSFTININIVQYCNISYHWLSLFAI